MFNRTRSLQAAAALASISLFSGCGLVDSGSSDEEKPIVVGTTSAPSTLDPAAAWDSSWELYRNVYQTLVSYPTGAVAPEPDAAEACEFTDGSNTAYRCKLREGLKFSDGDPLDAKAVKHSIDRIRKIGVEGGPEGLLGSLDRVDTSGSREVTFHLKKADATFPSVLATPAMSIVDPKEYPADSLRKGDGVIGSGPYLLDSYKEGKSAQLSRNPDYKGFAEHKNNAVTIRYFQDSKKLVQSLKKKQIDVALRGLTPEDVVDLQGSNAKQKGLQLVEGAGTEIRFLVFNPKDQWTKNPAVRKAVAQIIDRGSIAHNVYKDTVEPLYSMVPTGVAGHTTGFFDTFGKPSAEKARRILTEAGVNTPVPLTLWYATDRYGSVTKPEFEEIRRQLNDSGLFDVTVKGRPWKQFSKGFQDGEYTAFGRGWNPDFPDPENFIAPFVGEHNNLGTPYATPRITDQLLPQTRRETDRGAVAEEFEEAQEILVRDARLIPVWQGKQYIAASEEIAGSERALDPSMIMVMWELGRKTSW